MTEGEWGKAFQAVLNVSDEFFPVFFWNAEILSEVEESFVACDAFDANRT